MTSFAACVSFSCLLVRADQLDNFLPVTGPPGCGKTLRTTELASVLQASQEEGHHSVAGCRAVNLDVKDADIVTRVCNMLYQVILQIALMGWQVTFAFAVYCPCLMACTSQVSFSI